MACCNAVDKRTDPDMIFCLEQDAYVLQIQVHDKENTDVNMIASEDE